MDVHQKSMLFLEDESQSTENLYLKTSRNILPLLHCNRDNILIPYSYPYSGYTQHVLSVYISCKGIVASLPAPPGSWQEGLYSPSGCPCLCRTCCIEALNGLPCESMNTLCKHGSIKDLHIPIHLCNFTQIVHYLRELMTFINNRNGNIVAYVVWMFAVHKTILQGLRTYCLIYPTSIQ